MKPPEIAIIKVDLRKNLKMLESIQEKKKKERKEAKAVFILKSAHERSQSCEFLAFRCKAAPSAQASG